MQSVDKHDEICRQMRESGIFDAGCLDSWINGLVEPVANFLYAGVFATVPIPFVENDAGNPMTIKLILIWLVGAALFFTMYFNFINIRGFVYAFRNLFKNDDSPEAVGHITNFQALMTSLSGTVGLGNIAGVAVAISIGGPGAAFWLFIMGFVSMSTKFAEITMGIKHRHTWQDETGFTHVSGGPMYYIEHAFANMGIKWLGVVLAIVFGVCAMAGAIGANLFQAQQGFVQLVSVTGGEDGEVAKHGWLFGVIIGLMVAVVIIGGIKSIASVASKIVPFMGAVYVLAGLYVILSNFMHIPAALGIIVSAAFVPEAGIGAVLGALLMGVQRAVFSNEAGLGSAAITHAAVKTHLPVRQGIIGMLGPFFDTIIVCMVTALVIVISGAYEDTSGVVGVSLTSAAFESSISWFPYLLAFTVFLFAYSTMIGWFYNGLKGCTYVFGESKTVEMTYKILYCFLLALGPSASLENIIHISDSILFTMAVPNLLALYVLAPSLKRDLKEFLKTTKL